MLFIQTHQTHFNTTANLGRTIFGTTTPLG